jgi:hypothetical protein
MNRIGFKSVLLITLIVIFGLASISYAEEYKADFSKWKQVSGKWKVVDGGYENSDVALGNTNSYVELKQEGTELVYEWTIELGKTTFEWGPAAGMHILCSEATSSNRGKSYLIFQDDRAVRVYKADGSSLPEVLTINQSSKVGETYKYKVEFNTKTGVMKVFRDGKEIGQWRDLMPIKSGNFISARTNGTFATYKDVTVTMK